MSDGNGNGHAPVELKDRLILDLDRVTMTMQIGGVVVNDDTALEMCLRAARVFETKLRVQAAAQMKLAADEALRTRTLMDQVRGKV